MTEDAEYEMIIVEEEKIERQAREFQPPYVPPESKEWEDANYTALMKKYEDKHPKKTVKVLRKALKKALKSLMHQQDVIIDLEGTNLVLMVQRDKYRADLYERDLQLLDVITRFPDVYRAFNVDDDSGWFEQFGKKTADERAFYTQLYNGHCYESLAYGGVDHSFVNCVCGWKSSDYDGYAFDLWHSHLEQNKRTDI